MAIPHLRLIVGEFGSGKSLRLLEMGLELAERYKKGIVANFPINKGALREYCKAKGYKWIPFIIQCKQIIYKPVLRTSEMHQLLNYRSKVILLDEAGIFLNSRSWAKVSDDFLASLVQVRKDFNIFILACHFLEQVDKQVRENCQQFVVCQGNSIPDSSGFPRLVVRHWFEFKPASFRRWEENPQWQSNFFRTWVTADKKKIFSWLCPFRVEVAKSPHGFFFTRIDIKPGAVSLLFDCFDSAARLDKPRRLRSAPNMHFGYSPLPESKPVPDIFTWD